MSHREDMNFVERQLSTLVRLLLGADVAARQSGKDTNCDLPLLEWSHGVDARKYRYYFRGEPACDYRILPKIARSGCNLLDKENQVRSEMIRASPNEFRGGAANPIEQLIVMQHYGVPTRLLDVTRNFLVALYFACQPSSIEHGTDTDGIVLLFQVSRLGSSKYIEGEVFRELEYYNPFVNYLIGEIRDKVGRVPLRKTSVISRGKPKEIEEWCHPLILRSAYLSERQRVQSGHFLFFPDKYKDGKFSKELCDEPKPSQMLIIKQKTKCHILEWLDLFFGINKKNLFPEDVDGGCGDMLENIKKGIVI